MKNDELICLVNEKDELIGPVLKSEAHSDKFKIHREAAVFIFTESQEGLFQQRSFDKTFSPGQWKISAAGHVGYGEEPAEAMKREIKEELGIKVDKLTYWGKNFKEEVGEIVNGVSKEQARFFWLYYVILDDRADLKLQKEEVNDARWVGLDERSMVDFSQETGFNLESGAWKSMKKCAEELGLISL
jgi:isopentenyldiphosphate isomerase